ncbi:hypothetical protein Fot_11828 [Forsythia ovata]|uniref:Uncharacterized protein n=1 Tax=Forsythia ovata TaxID=205694 RepID=A0ABD1WNH8_9LAMI
MVVGGAKVSAILMWPVMPRVVGDAAKQIVVEVQTAADTSNPVVDGMVRIRGMLAMQDLKMDISVQGIMIIQKNRVRCKDENGNIYSVDENDKLGHKIDPNLL